MYSKHKKVWTQANSVNWPLGSSIFRTPAPLRLFQCSERIGKNLSQATFHSFPFCPCNGIYYNGRATQRRWPISSVPRTPRGSALRLLMASNTFHKSRKFMGCQNTLFYQNAADPADPINFFSWGSPFSGSLFFFAKSYLDRIALDNCTT
jgi:hypothetical protein